MFALPRPPAVYVAAGGGELRVGGPGVQSKLRKASHLANDTRFHTDTLPSQCVHCRSDAVIPVGGSHIVFLE